MKQLYFLLCFVTFLGPKFSFGQTGNLDPEFGSGNGFVTTEFFTDRQCQGYAIAVQNDGKILESGYTKSTDGHEYASLSCHNPDGALDGGFGDGGKVIIAPSGQNAYSRKVLLQPDGKILVLVDYFDTAEVKVAICRFLSDGSPDNSFDGDGIANKSFGAKYLGTKAMTLQPDGKILVGGYIGFDQDTFDRFYVSRFLPNGSPDNSFDGDGTAITFVGEAYTGIYNILVQPDGKIIASGFAEYNGYDDFAALRYAANGSVDHSFGTEGIAHITVSSKDDRALGSALQPDGKIVLGGYAFNPVTNKNEFAAARLNADGTPDLSFHGDGKVSIALTGEGDGAYAMVRQPDGKIILGGYAHSNRIGGSDMALLRLSENGIPDFTFSGDGIAVYEDNEAINSLYGMAIQPDGKLVSTGLSTVAGVNSVLIARFLTGLTTSTDEELVSISDVSLFPNPVLEEIDIHYQLEKAERISINLCDMDGRIVQRLMEASPRSGGNHAEELRIGQSLPAGIYLLNLQAEGWIKSMKVLVE